MTPPLESARLAASQLFDDVEDVRAISPKTGETAFAVSRKGKTDQITVTLDRDGRTASLERKTPLNNSTGSGGRRFFLSGLVLDNQSA